MKIVIEVPAGHDWEWEWEETTEDEQISKNNRHLVINVYEPTPEKALKK